MIPIIDTHQHIWDLSRLSLPWIKGLERMDRNYLMSDYLKESEGTGIAASIYMEVDVEHQLRNREIGDITAHCANSDVLMKGMVIAGDPETGEISSYLDKHSGNNFIKGVRRMLQVTKPNGDPQYPPGYCLTQSFLDGVRELGRRGLLFSICIRPSELNDAIELVKQCPETMFVLDHCGNADPYVVNGENAPLDNSNRDHDSFSHTREGWLEGIGGLGNQPNVICKISGIVARAQEGWTAETLAPTIDACLNAFGSERVIFGGDWPVCLNGSSLASWVRAFRTILSKRDMVFQHNAMHINAERIYGVSL